MILISFLKNGPGGVKKRRSGWDQLNSNGENIFYKLTPLSLVSVPHR